MFYKCRLCLKRSDQGRLRPTWSQISSSSERVHFVTNISVRNGDDFPAFICDQCSFELSLADVFIQRSLASDNVLRSEMACATNTTQSSSTLSRNRLHAATVDLSLLDSELINNIKEEPETGFENEIVAESNCSSLNEVKNESEHGEDISSILNKCRLCLGRSEQVAPISSFAESIAFVTKIKMQDGDGLPAFVCGQCTFELSLADSFIRRCVANDNALQSAVSLNAISQEAATADPIHLGLQEVVDFKEEPEGFDEPVELKSEEELGGDPLMMDHAPSSTSSCDNFASQQTIATPRVETELSNDFQEIENNTHSNNQGCISQTTSVEARKGRKQKTKFTCNICNTSFKFVTFYNLHLRTHTAEERLTADRFDNVDRRLVQEKNVSAPKAQLFSCATCEKSFVRKGNLLNHEKSHIAELSSHSSESGEVVFEPVNLNGKAKKCKESQKCCKCGKKFPDKYLLACHYTSIHTERCLFELAVREENQEKCLKCCKCKVEFLDKYLLACHYTAFHTERQMFLDFMEGTANQSTIVPQIDRISDTVSVGDVDLNDITHLAEMENSKQCGTIDFVKSSSGSALKSPIDKHTPVQTQMDIMDGTANQSTIDPHTDRISDTVSVADVDVNVITHMAEMGNSNGCGGTNNFVKSSSGATLEGPIVTVQTRMDFIEGTASQNTIVPHIDRNSEIVSTDNLDIQNITHMAETGNSKRCGSSVSALKSPIKKHKPMRKGMDFVGENTILPPNKGNAETVPVNDVYSLVMSQLEEILKRKSCAASKGSIKIKKHKQKRRRLTCDICKISFKTKKKLFVHKERYLDKKPHQCKICQEGFDSNEQLVSHKKLRTCKAVFDCKKCHKSYQRKVFLTAHIKKVCGPSDPPKSVRRRFTCDICKSSFKSKEKLLIHIERYMNEKAYQCKNCARGFDSNELLASHEKLGSCMAVFECRNCHKSYQKKVSLNKHLFEVHYPDSGKQPQYGRYICAECGHHFSFKDGLKTHVLKKHVSSSEFIKDVKVFEGFDLKMLMPKPKPKSDDVPIECVLCGLNIIGLNLMTDHLITHGEESLNCSKCVLTFSAMEYFMDHMIEKHHNVCKCSCKGNCVAYINLDCYVIDNYDNTKFACDICKNSYFSKQGLMQHISNYHIEHEIGKRYQCRICKKGFNGTNFLQNHEVKHYYSLTCRDAIHICEICGVSYPSRSSLTSHRRYYSKRCAVSGKSIPIQNSRNNRNYLKFRGVSCDLLLNETDLNPQKFFAECIICGARLPSRKILYSHIASHGLLDLNCSICLRSFVTLQAFKDHMIEKHYKLRECICLKCGRKCSRQVALKSHLLSCQGPGKKLQCIVCGLQLLSLKDLVDHVATHGEKECECKECGLSFATLENYTSHVMDKHYELGECVFCDKCGFAFTSSATLNNHSRWCKIYTIGEYFCDACNKSFFSHIKWMEHNLKTCVKNDKNYTKSQKECVECGYSIPNKKIFLSHMAAHGKKELKCNKCAKTFSNMVRYIKHMRNQHYIDREFVCEKCGCCYTNILSLKLHLKFCQGLQQCTVCAMKGMSIHQLSIHLVNHGKTEPECKECTLTFATVGTFLTHMFYTHYEFGQFAICDECGRVFESPESLHEHKDLCKKTLVKSKYVCDICRKTCTTKKRLDFHISKHLQKINQKPKKLAKNFSKCGGQKKEAYTNDRPFICGNCHKSFTTKGSLKLHIHSVHLKLKRFQCNVCELKFLDKTDLILHLKSHM